MSLSGLLTDCGSKEKASLLLLVSFPLGLADRLRFLEFDAIGDVPGREEARRRAN